MTKTTAVGFALLLVGIFGLVLSCVSYVMFPVVESFATTLHGAGVAAARAIPQPSLISAQGRSRVVFGEAGDYQVHGSAAVPVTIRIHSRSDPESSAVVRLNPDDPSGIGAFLRIDSPGEYELICDAPRPGFVTILPPQSISESSILPSDPPARVTTPPLMFALLISSAIVTSVSILLLVLPTLFSKAARPSGV